jgi:anti-sigma factor RsiW
MNHNDIRHKLSEYIDNAITPDERAAIDEHLKTCTACSDALNELRKTIEQVKQLEEVESPAWMTQKIMAKVRAEAEEKKSFFHRLFYPLAIKLPIQAVGVLFLTVTAYYIYSSMHPAEKYAETPMGRLAKQEAPAELQDAAKRKAAEVPAEREKKVAQEPGYKSLDMKYEYEKPAPPVPAPPGAGIVAARDESAASAPARRSAPMRAKEEAALENKQAAPKAAAPSVTAEQAAPSREATRDTGKTAKKAKAAAADREADDTLEVTEHFVHIDLPDKMKVKGLRFNTRKISDETPGLQWLREMPSYRNNSCESRFLVDVEFPDSSLKYLYCHDRAGIRLLGIFALTDGVWSEKK